MINNSNEHRIAIQFYSEVSVSDELWNELQKEDNDKAIHEITNKYGFVLMTDKEAEIVPEWIPVIYAMDGIDNEEEIYLA